MSSFLINSWYVHSWIWYAWMKHNQWHISLIFPISFAVSLIKLGETLAAKQSAAASKHGSSKRALLRLEFECFAEANRTAEIIRLFTICTGLVRGISDHSLAMFQWLHPVVKDAALAIAHSYILYPDVLRSILKFLYRMSVSMLTKLDAAGVRDLLLSIQTVTHSFVDCYEASFGELMSKGADEDAVRNIGYLFK